MSKDWQLGSAEEVAAREIGGAYPRFIAQVFPDAA